MGDRAYCRIEIAEAHRAALEPLLEQWGFTEEGVRDETAKIVSFADSEANYGGQDVIADLKTRSLPFTGWHEAGGEYGEEVFAFDGKEYAEVWSHEGDPVCIVNKLGEAQGLETAREYLAVCRSAEAAMAAAVMGRKRRNNRAGRNPGEAVETAMRVLCEEGGIPT